MSDSTVTPTGAPASASSSTSTPTIETDATTNINDPLLSSINDWCEAESASSINQAMQKVLQCLTPESLTSMPLTTLVPLLTNLLQAHISNSGVPSAGVPLAHQQKLLLDRLHSIILTISPTPIIFQAIETILATHTPITTNSAASSRRNSLQLAAGGMSPMRHKRRNSQPMALEEQTIATIRLQTFKFAFEYLRAHLGKGSPVATSEPNSNSSSDSTVSNFSIHVHLIGLRDMWSAVRKCAASDLSSTKRGALLPTLTSEQLQFLFEELMNMGGVGLVNDRPLTWQEQEGAMAGVDAFFHALRQHQAAKQMTLPQFIATLTPARFFPLLSHAQLSVREYTTNALQNFISLLQEGGVPAAADVKQQLVKSLTNQLQAGMVDPSGSNLSWLSDYESEGDLTVLLALDLPFDSSYIHVLDHYLAHPASSVRQQVSEILSKLAIHHPSFDLLELLSSNWTWDEQEQEAYLQFKSGANMMGDAHTTAMYFAIPPPLTVEAATRPSSAYTGFSPRVETGHRSTTSLSSTPRPLPTASTAIDEPSSPVSSTHSCPSTRSTWQWKEGALMTLELYLRALPSRLRSYDASKMSSTLAQLYPQVVRASLSWSWELRRMSEQLRLPFFGIWMELAQAGSDLIQLYDEWLQTGKNVVTSLAPHPTPVSLLPAASAVIALQSCLQHLQKCQHSLAAPSLHDKEDAGIERKWNQELDQCTKVDPQVWRDLASSMTPLLNRIEQLVVSTMLNNHSISSNPALSISPSIDNLSSMLQSTGAASTPLLIHWEQFSTLAIQMMVSAYAVLGASTTTTMNSNGSKTTAPLPPAPPATLQVSQQSQLQHYQCVLDRLRTIRSLSVGDGTLPAPSVAAQMVGPTTPTSSSPVLSSANNLTAAKKLTILPTLSLTQTPTMTPITSPHPKHAALTRQRAKQLESWLLTHMSGSLAGFASCVPGAAHVDLLDLLLDYLTRFHSHSSEIRLALLRAIAVGWTHSSHLHPQTVGASVWSHQMHQLQEDSLSLLLQLLSEHLSDRGLTVAALMAIVANTPLHVQKLHQILEAIANLISDEYLTLSLDTPPPVTPNVLSPASAAVAASTEAWDDWDEDDADDGNTNAGGNGENESATETWNHAKQLVLDVAPLVWLLQAQSYATVLQSSLNPPPRKLSRPTAPSTVSNDASSTASSSSPAVVAHAQSSLSQLVAAYEHAATAAIPDAPKQIQLLQWISQWATQVQQQISENQTAAATSTPTSRRIYSMNDRMPLNPLFRSTLESLSSQHRTKLSWLQQQGEQLGIGRAESSSPASSS